MSGFTLPGEYLLDLIVQQNRTLPAKVESLDDLTDEQILSANLFGLQNHCIIEKLQKYLLAQAKTSGKRAFAADDLVPSLVYLIYQAISNTPDSLEEKLAKLASYKDTLLRNMLARDLCRAQPDSLFSKELAQINPGAIEYFMTSSWGAIASLEGSLVKLIADQKADPTLNVAKAAAQLATQLAEDATQLTPEQNQTFLAEIAAETDKKSQEFLADIEREKAQTLKAMMIANLDALIGQTSLILDGLKSKSFKDPLFLIEDAVFSACEQYQSALMDIRTQIEESSENHPVDFFRFISKKRQEIQDETDILANNEKIHLLNTTKNNWLVQKLSDLVRSAYNLIDRILPNWSWLYHPVNNQLHQTIQTAKSPQLLLDFDQKTRPDSGSESPPTPAPAPEPAENATALQSKLRTSRL